MGVFGLLLPLCALAVTPQLSTLPIAGLDREYRVDGVIMAAYRTHLDQQQHTLILSNTGTFRVDGHDARSARLYATLFADGDDGARQRWLIEDLVDTCPVDVTAQFRDPATTISDADGDGTPEIWIAYLVTCRSDVSPATLKLIGHEGAQKYALRGHTRMLFPDSTVGGEYEADPALKRAPKLLEHASKLWMAVRDEHF